MSGKKIYAVLVVIDDDAGIVDVSSHSGQGHGTQRYQTAWFKDDGTQRLSTDGVETDDEGQVLHPEYGHEIMTYNDRDEAIGEAMTSLRDHVDDEDRYLRTVKTELR